MKLATFEATEGPRIGLVHSNDSRILDLAAAVQRLGTENSPFKSMLSLIDAGPAALDIARKAFEAHGSDEALSVGIAQAEILSPLPEPRQMRDGMSFPLHILQAPRGQLKLAARAKGDMAELSQVMDYELEFGIVTKGKAANISVASARDHIFGFTIFNDFSARDAQRVEMEGRLGPAKGKSFDGGNVLGPWIVTPDEIGDPYNLKMECRVNGKIRSQGVTKGMLFSFEEIIAHVTQDETLMPGEFIGSGTVGNGCGLELGQYLEHGDTIELEVEKIGILKNRVERQDA